MSRRRSLLALVLAASAAALAVSVGAARGAVPPAADTPTRTPIKHFVMLLQENHSFDNYFGTYPGANGIPAGVCMPIRPSKPKACIRPFHITSGSRDLGHDVTTFETEYDHGRMDGFVKAVSTHGNIRRFGMGHYDRRDLPWYWNMADNYVLFDRYFTSAHGGSTWNHLFWVTATPGNFSAEKLPAKGYGSLPTIFDRLQARHISWKFYVTKYYPHITYRNPGVGDHAAQTIWVPLLDYARYLDNPELRKHIVPLSQYYYDLQHNTLPAVAYVSPSGASEHPPGRVQAGQRFVRTMVNALMESRSWRSSAFLLAYDDWGGFWDHVKPPKVDKYGYGLRAPMMLISPYARKGYVDHTTVDLTSALKFIEQNWGVKPLAARDRKANNFLGAFDFTASPRGAVFLPNGPLAAAPVRTRSSVVYLMYGSAIAATLALIGFGALRTRRRRGQDPPARTPDAGLEGSS